MRKDNQKLVIRDSYAILTSKLSNLAKAFDVSTLKSVFTYKFATKNNLNYKGSTPSREEYNCNNVIE